jgi:hypothetical protein
MSAIRPNKNFDNETKTHTPYSQTQPKVPKETDVKKKIFEKWFQTKK